MHSKSNSSLYSALAYIYAVEIPATEHYTGLTCRRGMGLHTHGQRSNWLTNTQLQQQYTKATTS